MQMFRFMFISILCFGFGKTTEEGVCESGEVGQLCENEATDDECEKAIADPPTVGNNSVSTYCSLYTNFAKLCRKRCLSCCELPQYSCSDSPDEVPFMCPAIKSMDLCQTKDPLLKPLIQKGCAQTCGLCSASDCKDLYPIMCEKEKNSCIMERYEKFMAEVCPKTCEKCGCVDKLENCGEYQSLCDNIIYESIILENCRKTCGKCEKL